MSTASTATALLSMPLITRRIRVFFAPVTRATKAPTIFDPAISGAFSLSSPPSPWIDLGWISNFQRTSGSVISAMNTGAPSIASYQLRTAVEASVSFQFEAWSKLSMGLAAGAQHMNVLSAPGGGTAIGSGAKATPALSLGTGSSSTTLVMDAASTFATGSIVAVDVDYAGQSGFVGSGVSGAYVTSATAVGSDPDYIRRVSFNVGRVVGTGPSTLTLAQPLLAGTPVAGMKVQQVVGLVDREGGSFFQEWSALFVMQGEQGDRLIFHYPRLQSKNAPHETSTAMASPLQAIGLAASFRALPVADGNDSEQILCYRTYLPGPATLV